MSESKKPTIDEEILARLQQLEVIVMEQRKEIDLLKEQVKKKADKQTLYC